MQLGMNRVGSTSRHPSSTVNVRQRSEERARNVAQAQAYAEEVDGDDKEGEEEAYNDCHDNILF